MGAQNPKWAGRHLKMDTSLLFFSPIDLCAHSPSGAYMELDHDETNATIPINRRLWCLQLGFQQAHSRDVTDAQTAVFVLTKNF